MKKMIQKIRKSLVWKTLSEEWKVWVVILLLLILTWFFSDKLATWLTNSTFIKTLDSLSKLGILVAVIAFLRQISKWKKRVKDEKDQRIFEYWKTVDSANSARESSRYGRFTSHALRIALENLAKEKDKRGRPRWISNIDVSRAVLEGINLEDAFMSVVGFRYCNLSKANFSRAVLNNAYFQRARIFGADFSHAKFKGQILFMEVLYDNETKFPTGFDPIKEGAYKIVPKVDLFKANLSDGMLWEAQLSEADLREADLQRAVIVTGDLSRTKLQNANLKNAKMADANLELANLQNSNLEETALYRANVSGADFRGVRNMTVEQIKVALNWEQAKYDDDFRQQLGL
jgi:uncharacterized protein YjbI with pentapeptide repeats